MKIAFLFQALWYFYSESIIKDETNESNFMSNEKILKILQDRFLPSKDVFDKKTSNDLPLHIPWDCKIKLKPDAKLLYGPIYPLTEKKDIALKKYVKELQYLIGYINYYCHFVPWFIKLVQFFNNLLKKIVKFNLSSEIQSAFDVSNQNFFSFIVLA